MTNGLTVGSAFAELDAVSRATFFTSPEAAKSYLTAHVSRFVDTVEALRPAVHAGDKLLEIGIRPYLLSVLLQRQLGVVVDGVNDGPTEDFQGIHTYGINIEKERVPRPDGYYDVVLLCEVLEHLLDPAAALAEVNRLLKVGGRLFVSTPNAVALVKALRPLLGRNPFPGYSATSVYGRHNREYTAPELRQALPAWGFTVNGLAFRNYRTPRGRPAHSTDYLTAVVASRRRRLDALCTKVGPIVEPHPESIYRNPEVEYKL